MKNNMKTRKKEWAEEGYAFYDRMHPFKCLHCNRNFKDYPYLYEHVLREMNRLWEHYQNKIKQTYGYEDKDPRLIDKTEAELNKSERYDLLRKTLKENENKRPFICNICYKNFQDRQTLKGHYLRVHHIDVKNAIPKPSQDKNV